MNKSLYLVLGLGLTGLSMLRYLERREQPCVIFDSREDLDTADAFRRDYPAVPLYLGELPDSIFPQLKAVLASPGFILDEAFIDKAAAYKLPIYGDIECFAQEVQAPVIAITGTNGKSTVTSLVGEMAKAAGLKVAVAGNIGVPVLDLLALNDEYELWVLELSSFQLDLTQSLRPKAATILNISPDHLDRHQSFAAYKAAKQSIYRHADVLLYNREDKDSFPVEVPHQGQRACSFGLDEPGPAQWGIQTLAGEAYLSYQGDAFFSTEALKLKGLHNWQNALAAAALAQAAGISFKAIKEVLANFSGLPHRCQWVRTHQEVTWINDSKGTNVGATLSAISGIAQTLKNKIILIAGGMGKGADFSLLCPALAQYVRFVILIGEDAQRMELVFAPAVAVQKTASLEHAVDLAAKTAQPGEVVLLSPACASFDMFRDFNHRGEAFAALVQNL